jgi:hypothetical protein
MSPGLCRLDLGGAAQLLPSRAFVLFLVCASVLQEMMVIGGEGRPPLNDFNGRGGSMATATGEDVGRDSR